MTDFNVLDQFMAELNKAAEEIGGEGRGLYNVVPAMLQSGWVAKTTGDRPDFFPIVGPESKPVEEARADAMSLIASRGEEARLQGKRHGKGVYPNLFTGVRVRYYMEHNFGGVPNADDLVWDDVHFFMFSERRHNAETGETEWGAWNKKMVMSMWTETEHGGPVFASADYGRVVYAVVRQETDRTFCWEDLSKNDKYNSTEKEDAETGEVVMYPRRIRIITEIYDDLELAKARAAELGVEINNDNLGLPNADVVSTQSSIPAPDGYDESALGAWADMRDYLVDELTPILESPKPVQNKKVKALQKELDGLSETDLVSYVLERLAE